ncbi:uncharacterized protein LOC131092035 [Melospiza georgiana]|uniref:uncharacterized protein LOC131092035 n=1 Tax=Melospiza georgiana TaxID=44398 RepID=UPI0025AD73C5|nr:uncharacterized protein LOC131092035 [Melospiza georgiana]
MYKPGTGSTCCGAHSPPRAQTQPLGLALQTPLQALQPRSSRTLSHAGPTPFSPVQPGSARLRQRGGRAVPPGPRRGRCGSTERQARISAERSGARPHPCPHQRLSLPVSSLPASASSPARIIPARISIHPCPHRPCPHHRPSLPASSLPASPSVPARITIQPCPHSPAASSARTPALIPARIPASIRRQHPLPAPLSESLPTFFSM